MTVDTTATDYLLVDMWSLYPTICAYIISVVAISLTTDIHLKYISCEVHLDDLEASQLMFYLMLMISLIGE